MMPASATPMGSPIARTEPKATTRITTAKARPSASDAGSSNSPKVGPAELDLHAVDLGKSSCRVGDRPASAQSVPGSRASEGDLAGVGTLGRDLRLGVGS